MADGDALPLRTLIVDDEPLAVERMQVICAKMDELAVIGTAADGAAALRLVDALARRGSDGGHTEGAWLEELWVPHRAELLRIEVAQVSRIDAERDYVRLHVGDRSYLLLQTIAGLEARLDPTQFIRIHRSTILRRDCIRGLRHDGLGVWSIELEDGDTLRIGRTYLAKVKAMAGR